MTAARRIVVSGLVQGVGFRPFVYKLACRHQLTGRVRNRQGLVDIVVEGADDAVHAFVDDLVRTSPSQAQPDIVCCEPVQVSGHTHFLIADSVADDSAQIFISPDTAPCAECLHELADPGNRRYRYPFINCTQCGPRFTLIERMPYDRARTTMRDFPMCDACRAEYTDPLDRRFHAEPIACPACGPVVEYAGAAGEAVAFREAALESALALLASGGILAVKGVGGYHLLCDARNDETVLRLRRLKQRPEKPLAVMFACLEGVSGTGVSDEAHLDPDSAQLLAQQWRPIVLLPKRSTGTLSVHIAPGLHELGAVLPYSPLHQLLCDGFDAPLVATSANLSGEPVLTQASEVVQRLGHVADGFLHHNRPIARPADDPVFRTVAGALQPLRIGRGSAPLELSARSPLPQAVLALGGHLKNTVALAWDDRVVVSAHIGDLYTPRSMEVWEAAIRDLQQLYAVTADAVVCDAHPGYASHRWARTCGLPVTSILHHHAHASALAAEHGLQDRLLVFTWDGAGFGSDDTLWGGETLIGLPGSWQRVASQRLFRLPGGDRVARAPWRSAAALCWETDLRWSIPGTDDEGLVHQAWHKHVNTVPTSSVGRLFDAAAAIVTGIRNTTYEGQGPALLESMSRAADGSRFDSIPLPITEAEQGLCRVDWGPLVDYLLDERIAKTRRAAGFHQSLAQNIVDQACRFRDLQPFDRVGLCGGVFQNRILTELAAGLLEEAGFKVCLMRKVPCNDAGLSYGQAVEYAALAGNRGVDVA